MRVLCGEYAPATDTGTEIELAISEPPVAFWEEGTQFTNVRRDPIASVKRNRMGGLSYVFNVEPQSTGGEATVMVPAGVIEDESGNANTASETLHVARNRGLSVADSSAMEGTDGTLDFEVTLDARNDCETVTVDWSTADGTATAGEDYSAASGTLTFGPGETTKTVSVAILDDEVEDTGETFTLRLSNALGVSIASNTSGVTIADAEATGTINNDESQQQVTSDTEPPTGLPAISGTARVGKTLTASVSEIADADGLTGVSYAYQWIANDGSTDTDIASATAASYMLVAGDVGKTVKVRVTFTDGGGTEETLTSAATGAVVAANSLPTGLPTIAGTAQVGETLTAAVSGIADADGLTGVSYAYQWITNDGTSDTDIAGAAEASYTLTSAEAGKTVKVRVTFTDDGGTEETLTSAATAAVAVPLTASFENVPAEHDGIPTESGVSNAFTFELRFSEEIAIGYQTVRDSVLAVTGGTVTGARRLEGPSNIRWEITADPNTNGDVTVALPSGRACNERGAVCTSGGKQLSNGLTISIPGPASGNSANTAATGLPAISGTAQVGETFTASVSGIADEDGLTGATYAYQWITDDGTSDTDIAGATEASYTLTSAEAGKTVKVRVTFTDDGGTEETLTSAATAAVVVPLTGEFLDMPDDGHDGSTAFTFELKFSEEISISYVTLRDSAFEVIGGSVTGARRLEQGKNQRWEITVELDTQEDLTIALPVGPACGEPNAICTAGRKQLSRRLEATVPGPASTTAQEEPASTTVMRTLWSSTLTVGQPDFLGFIGSGNGGSLSSAGWSESGRAHTVGGVNLALFGLSSDRPNELWVELSPTPGNLDGLTLHVGGRAHALSEAVVTGNRFAWPVGGLTWAAGDRVFLRLVRTVEVAAPGTGLSVADVEMREGPNAVLRFPVTLTPASSSTVTVDYATSDGTAEAGADYTETSGTLTFAPGETKKTIPVAVLDDDHDEGMETLTLTLSGASGAEIAAASAAGRIVNTDAMPKAWLARFGRTVAGQVIDAVEARLTAPPWAGVEASLAGQALPRWNADGRADGTARTDAAHAGAQEEAGAGARLAALSDWLQGDRREDPGSGSGAGVATVGLLLAHSRGEGGYRGAQAGTVSSTVTGLYPYGRYMVNPRVTLWGVAGYGAGTLTLTPEKGDAMRTDLELMMAAAGVRGVAVEAPADGGFELAVTSDAMAVRTASEKVAGLVAATADVTLLRLGLEGSWRGLAAGGGELTPRLEVGLRLDGGDAETGFGADIGGGLAWSHAKSGVTADIGARSADPRGGRVPGDRHLGFVRLGAGPVERPGAEVDADPDAGRGIVGRHRRAARARDPGRAGGERQ